MRPLLLFSYNVRGLASRTRRVRARILLESLHGKPDVLCLQEHELLEGAERTGFGKRSGILLTGSLRRQLKVYMPDETRR